MMKKADLHYISIGIDILACLLLAGLPEQMDPVLALYPMFFATAVQWLAFTGAAGYNSATIFSTNNLRQCFASLSEYLYEHKAEQKRKCIFTPGPCSASTWAFSTAGPACASSAYRAYTPACPLLAAPLVMMSLREERHPLIFKLGGI